MTATGRNGVIRQADLSVAEFSAFVQRFAVSQVSLMLARTLNDYFHELEQDVASYDGPIALRAHRLHVQASERPAREVRQFAVDVRSDVMPYQVNLDDARIRHEQALGIPVYFAFVIKDGYTILADAGLAGLLHAAGTGVQVHAITPPSSRHAVRREEGGVRCVGRCVVKLRLEPVLSRVRAWAAEVVDYYLIPFYQRFVAKPPEWPTRSWWWKSSYIGYRVTILWNLFAMASAVQSLVFEDRSPWLTRLDQVSLALTAVVTAACSLAVWLDVRKRERQRLFAAAKPIIAAATFGNVED